MKKKSFSDYAIFIGIAFVMLAYLWISLPKSKSSQPKFIEESSEYKAFEAAMIQSFETTLGIKYVGYEVRDGEVKAVWVEDTANPPNRRDSVKYNFQYRD